MTIKRRFLISLAAGQIAIIFISANVLAQAKLNPPSISFKSFTAVYHLSRDANNHSLLSTEEVILADFPSNSNFSGITRSIPKTYQGHSVDVKIIGVTDAAGNNVPYKTSTQGENLIVKTGDPAITLYGIQTFRLSYQTKDVVDINSKSNQFTLNVNGRGWDQPFPSVNATLFVPNSFSARLSGKPSCYIGYLKSALNNCEISNRSEKDQTIVTSKSTAQLAPHQALVMQLNFKPATFAAAETGSHWTKKAIILGLGILAIGAYYLIRSRRR